MIEFGIEQDFESLVDEFIFHCGYSKKDAEKAARGVILEDFKILV